MNQNDRKIFQNDLNFKFLSFEFVSYFVFRYSEFIHIEWQLKIDLILWLVMILISLLTHKGGHNGS